MKVSTTDTIYLTIFSGWLVLGILLIKGGYK